MVLLFFEVSIVDENGRVHGRIKREIDRDAAYIGNRAVEGMRLGVMPGGMDAVVQMMRVREFRKGLLEDAAKMAGRQLAEFLEDREGWHGLDRADSAEARLSREEMMEAEDERSRMAAGSDRGTL